jgi:energy-coupling factor transporter transmembrane protein EcfT
MRTDNNIDNTYDKAKKRVKKLKDLYSHILAYIVLIPFWIFINYKTYWDFKWFWIPVLIMGISIIAHAFIVFRYNNEWEERKLKEFMDKDNF